MGSASALGGAAGAEDADVQVGGMGREAGVAEEVGRIGRELAGCGGGLRIGSSGLEQAAVGLDAAGLEAGEVEQEGVPLLIGGIAGTLSRGAVDQGGGAVGEAVPFGVGHGL